MKALLFALCLFASPAAAQDWLVDAPECAFGADARALGRMAIVYPRIGFPAVVEAGERLVARVRVPSALTPPPGIQRDRALYGWAVEILGDGLVIEQPAEHRYELRVADVRPDGPSSMIYRASIPIPAYVAPGTYALRLSAPGGTDAAVGVVRVIARGAAIRVGQLGELPRTEGESEAAYEARLRASLETLASAPIDVWIARASPPLLHALAGAVPARFASPPMRPVVLARDEGSTSSFVVANGQDAWQVGSFADCGPHALASARAQSESRSLRLVPAPAVAGGAHARGPGLDVSLDAAGPIATGAEIHAPSYAIERTFVMPEGARATRAVGGEGTFFPATPVDHAGAVPSLALRIAIPAGGTARIEHVAAPPLALSVHASPSPLPSGAEVTLRATASRPLALVAYQLDEDVSATGEVVRTRLRHFDEHRISVLAIGADGATDRTVLRLPVVPRIESGCQAAPCHLVKSPAALRVLWLAAILLVLLRYLARNNARRTPR